MAMAELVDRTIVSVWVRKDQTFDITGVMGIPPKVEYGREKDTRIRDDRFGDQAGD
jgi:hypothetical protein